MKITNAEIHFNENGTPFAKQFDDLYFSDASGIEETQHVFIQHNQLPQRWLNWQDSHFTIAETGFGTGLNFLVTLALFAQLRDTQSIPLFNLHFSTVEKYPLTKADLALALQRYPSLQAYSHALIEQYPPNVAGCHRLKFLNDSVIVDLWFGDVHEILPQIYATPTGLVDCWYLDGFAPSKNPEMWTEALFSQMARLAKKDCHYATFTAAGSVKRGLEAAGFSVKKVAGHGQKRHNLSGTLPQKTPVPWPKPYFARPAIQSSDASTTNSQTRIAIIGGGLAAANCAYALAKRGLIADVYCQDGTLAQGASGNHQGALYPQLNAIANHSSQFHALAYLYAGNFYKGLVKDNIQFAHQWCGVFQAAFNDKVLERQQKLIDHDIWPKELITSLTPAQASELAGLNLPFGGLYFPQGAWINPPELVNALFNSAASRLHTSHKLTSLSHTGMHWQLQFETQSRIETDIVIVATGSQFANIEQLTPLPLRGVRGQVEYIDSSVELGKLATVICHKGYLTPAHQGLHALGSSYKKQDFSTEYRKSEETENITMHQKALANCPWVDKLVGQGKGRAATRCSTADHLPMVGAVPNIPKQKEQFWDLYKALPAQHYPLASDFANLYLLNGLGSRGLTTAPLLAEVLASQICHEPLPLPASLLDALNPNRFLIRGLIRREQS
ncbi:bifunctional tRNA (5-methylaminomethyl-2-thiouridine)(34)-methyltransferase MnmD/FAD-dependent 5-carboxymethylaminomethyl-2-thiouridine(34) oxidoreductase MnmC [Flavobacterium sp. W21_SRS_FM6]|uniref:bifunctional tRNA (5-methylaminomethyl-2-thiouridine)(34)-methyltransferase MnmD/FAD-dependent 5-carboxymethylaminomethyl-2-thiouridine(34) oxidoreductase MnmC n=1 Tax=Flavobacterium sp. W21_SRS_FM6 TaxID=3240268 RepID=UPI003F8E1130